MRKKRSSWFYRMLLVFLLMIAVTSAALTVFSYRQYASVLTERMDTDHRSNLKKNAQNWENLEQEMRQLKSAVTTDSQVEQFMGLTAFSPGGHYLTYLKLKKLYAIHPLLHSFCLYNPWAEDAIFCGTDDFDLEAAWERLQRSGGKEIWTAGTPTEKKEILTFAYPCYISSFEEPEGAIFLNLDAEEAAKSVLGEMAYTQLLLSEGGEILLKQGREEMSEEAWKEIRMWAVRGEGDKTELLLDETAYVCYKSRIGEAEGWMVGFVPAREQIAALRQERDVFLLFCLAVMGVSALLEYAAIRRFYAPIRSLTEELEQTRYAKETELGEFELIRHVYEKAFHEISRLEEKNAYSRTRLKADILRGLVLGRLEGREAEEQLAELGEPVSFAGMFLAAARIDSGGEESLLGSALQARLQALFLEKAKDRFWVEAVPEGRNQVIAFLRAREGEESTFDELIERVEAVRDALLAEFEVTVTIGLNGMANHAGECGQIYAKMQDFMQNRFVLGENQVIYPKKVMELLPEPLTTPDRLMGEILQQMQRGEREAFEEKLEDFLGLLRSYHYQAASMLYARLYLSLADWLRQMGVTAGDSRVSVPMQVSPGTLEEGRELLLRLFTACEVRRRESERLRENKHYRTVQESLQYIQTHFKDCTLGAEGIAEQFGYSANYFARLFRSITGFYINDYIRQVRIRKAQELLAESDLTVGEIAQAAGFTTSNYFHAIFKKETGMTPAAYRSAGGRGEEQNGTL